MFETALRSDGQRRLAEIGSADLLIGIPSYKNELTIGTVIRIAAEGANKFFPNLKSAIAVVDGGSSDETVHVASSQPIPPSIHRIVTSYQGIQGKGSAVRTVFEIGRAVNAKACVVLEADLYSATPEWIQKMATPILNREFDLAIPHYARPLVEGAVNDILAYPLTRMLYNANVRGPMAGDFAISGDLAFKLHRRDVWETDVARHGIDIWITTIAINENLRMCQTPLTPKIENKREAAVAFDPGFVQSVGTLFRMMEIYRKRWPETKPLREIATCGENPTPGQQRLTSGITIDMLNDAFRSGARRYRRLWRSTLLLSNYEDIIKLVDKPRGALHFPGDLWARAVFDFAVVYNQGENDPDKVAAALLPLYYARIATILRETGGKLDAVEHAVQEQAKTFAQQKQYLIQRWQTYVPWAADGVR